jgi:hypothetical protein
MRSLDVSSGGDLREPRLRLKMELRDPVLVAPEQFPYCAALSCTLQRRATLFS